MTSIALPVLLAQSGPWSVETPISLPLDEPVQRLRTPVQICSSLWGPFQRLYLEGKVGPYKYMISTGLFESTPLGDGGAEISTTLHVDLSQRVAAAEIVMTRSASGTLVSAVMREQPGQHLDPASRQALSSGLSRPAGFLSRRTLRAGDSFQLPTSPDGSEFPDRAFALLCHVAGRSSYQGRPVVVLECHGAHPVSGEAWSGSIRATGLMAIDVETGLVLLSGLEGLVVGAPGAHDPPSPLASFGVRAWFTLERQAR